MPKNLKLTLQILVVLVACLASFQLAFAADEAPEAVAVTVEVEAQAETETQAKNDALMLDCGSEPAEVSFAAFDPDTAWGRQNLSCLYTCPLGTPALCPDRIDHVTACVHGCCVWYPI